MKRLFSIILLLSLLLTGCVVNLPEAPTEETEPTEVTQTLPTEAPDPADQIVGLAYDPADTFNPFTCMVTVNRTAMSLAYEGLFAVNSSFQAVPVLCSQFAVSEGGDTYLFTLQPGATFSDGTPVTAYDAEASLKAAQNSKYYGTRLYRVSDIAARDARTLRIRVRVPYENLPLLLDIPIVKAETVESPIPVGSGAYTIAQDLSCLTRREDWWQGSTGVIQQQTLPLAASPEPADVRDSFEFGDTALVCADPASPAAVGYHCDYELFSGYTTVMHFIGFNQGRGLCAQETFRKALTYLLDRETYVTKFYRGAALAAVLPCSPRSGSYNQKLADAYDFDPLTFKELTQDVNKTTLAELLVWSGDEARLQTAHDVADTLNAFGFNITVSAVDYNTYRSRLRSNSFDMYLGEVKLSPNFDLTCFFSDSGNLNFGHIANDGVTGLCRDALENSGNCYDLYKVILDRGLICPLLFKTNAIMARRGAFQGLNPGVDNVFCLTPGRTLTDASADFDTLAAAIVSE